MEFKRSIFAVGLAIFSVSSSAFAADPDGLTCTVILQALEQPQYDLIIIGDRSSEIAPDIEEALAQTKVEFENFLGSATFNVIVDFPEDNLALSERNPVDTYVICATIECDPSLSNSTTLSVDLEDGILNDADRLNAAGHIARASISMIQTREADVQQIGNDTRFELSREHLLTPQD
tara:strand:+ start:36 stop:566 length:531 start_codon:yes stop_codon:yes gene_type:complete